MAARQDRISIEVRGSGDAKDVARGAGLPSDDAVLRIARLIGRQIAREQFNRKHLKERGATARRNTSRER